MQGTTFGQFIKKNRQWEKYLFKLYKLVLTRYNFRRSKGQDNAEKEIL